MAVNNLQVIKNPGPTREYQAEDRTTASTMLATMKPGEPVKMGGTSTNFVLLSASGEPTVGDTEFVGIVRKESTETSTVDGEVEVITIIPVLTTIRGIAHTTTNLTASNLIGYLGDWVTFEWSADFASNVRINEDESSDPNVHGLKIVAGDVDKNTLDVVVHSMACEAGPYIV